MTLRVLSIGQCDYDHSQIARAVQAHCGAAVVPADNAVLALDQLKKGDFALILVNREFDVDHSSGLEFITRLKQDSALGTIPVMLVSNFPDAQEQAQARGALPGFGKKALDHPETKKRLQAVLG